jgi:pSer/pThr/pTyr-binding forkhead associated (FHA) protein
MQQRETTVTPNLVLSTGSRLLRRIAIDRPRLAIGRRPSNDVQLDDLTVSGEHAVLHTHGGESVIHDLNSRNGTLVNGVPVMQRVLAAGDRIEIGVYRLQYLVERTVDDPREDDAREPTEAPFTQPVPPDDAGAAPDPGGACVKVLSGHGAGCTIRLQRPIVSVSNGAGQVAVIARRRAGHHITHLEGPAYPLVNGESIGLGARPLHHLDLIELAGTILQFHAQPP